MLNSAVAQPQQYTPTTLQALNHLAAKYGLQNTACYSSSLPTGNIGDQQKPMSKLSNHA